MQPITLDSIQRIAVDLAGNLLPVLQTRAGVQPARDKSRDTLAGLLAPGVTAFVGSLMALAYDQDATLLPSVQQFFADPATAEALTRFFEGDGDSANDLYVLMLNAGLQGSGLLDTYFPQALDMLASATAAVIQRELPRIPEGVKEAARQLLAFGSGATAPDYGLGDFVEAYYTIGLDRVELGQAVAADGATIIYIWSPAPMAGLPEELATSAGPPEELAESTGTEPPDGSEGEEVLESIGGAGESPEELPVSPGSVPPPAPPPPAPTPPGETVVDLRLDAALPDHVAVGRLFDLAVAIRRPTSPVTAPDDLMRRESADFGAIWPDDALYIQFQIQIGAPDCDIQGGDTRSVRLHAGKDSPLVYFQLAPRLAGPLSVIITVYQETDWVGSTRLRTEATMVEPRGAMAITVNSQPVGNVEVNHLTLRKALDDGYNDSELRDLCFELGIDYDDLDGDNQSAKARELVLFAKRRDRVADLVRLIMRDRPHLLAAG